MHVLTAFNKVGNGVVDGVVYGFKPNILKDPE